MREILFRGKRKDNGAWETGGLVVVRGGCSDEQVFISDKMTGYHTPVLSETVGEFTGLTDKNGRKIFEGDIVKVDGDDEAYKIIYVYGVYRICDRHNQYSYTIHNEHNYLTVIGNMYDTPELLDELPEQKEEVWANALLSDGEIMFWHTGRERIDFFDFNKDFYYAGIGVEYAAAHKLELVKKKFEVDEDDIYANNRVFEVDARNFYRQFRISPDSKGEKPY